MNIGYVAVQSHVSRHKDCCHFCIKVHWCTDYLLFHVTFNIFVCVAGEGVAQPVWAVQVEPIFAMHWCMWVHACTFLFVANDISQKAMSAVCNICNADLPC